MSLKALVVLPLILAFVLFLLVGVASRQFPQPTPHPSVAASATVPALAGAAQVYEARADYKLAQTKVLSHLVKRPARRKS